MLVSGRVQGVCFRAWTRDKAKALGIVGYAKNLPDGRVEILAEGGDAVLEEFLAWCRQGPSRAEVRDIKLMEEVPQPGEYQHFAIRY